VYLTSAFLAFLYFFSERKMNNLSFVKTIKKAATEQLHRRRRANDPNSPTNGSPKNGQFCSIFPLCLPDALECRVNALSFSNRVAQFAAISPEGMPNPYELGFASVQVSVVVFLSCR
jgi:hypothetical protein